MPEHPRPDFERTNWLNLNGAWSFRFDPKDQGLQQRWFAGTQPFPLSINVPFPWGAPLSGVKDEADIAWYQRSITVPANWKGQRVFVTIGASDWLTTVWLDGQELGKHQGGYTPFSFELTRFLKPGQPQKLVVRVDDKRRDFTLYGKQGYGNARGIWQTIYLESRGDAYLDALHFTPDIDNNRVRVTAYLPEAAQKELKLNLRINGNNNPITATQNIPKGQRQVAFEVAIPNARRWTLDDPYLHTVEARLSGGTTDDVLKSYFGMRKISVMDMPGTSIPYVALNNQPIYLQLALDQSYHPEGYYTFPSDAFMRNEILMARQIGLNGIRTHIKADVPRKLYWADKLGVLVMADLPNSWGQPDEPMQKESEYTLREMIKRDYNHPAIFSWITFNETWGLTTKQKKANGKDTAVYTPETQKWVASVYRLAKSLDGSRIVEDNSICCGRGHTETDLNSWHEYLPGYAWEEYLAKLTKNIYPGSTANLEKGYKQGRQPNINSEFGNVWGYEGSTGDVDYTYDYHRAINTFRKYPQVAGWLYTEHHDVINEWNGYWRYDRTEKLTGLDELVPGMSLLDFHAPLYISTGQDITRTVKPGTTAAVPLFASFMTGRTDLGNSMVVSAKLYGWDALGQEKTWWSSDKDIPYQPWMQRALDSLRVPIPNEKSVAILALQLKDRSGTVHHRNFMTFVVDAPAPTELALTDGRKSRLVRFPAASFKDAKWSQKQWNVLDGKKVNGAGTGYFEYRVAVPKDINLANVAMASLVMEAGAKQLFGKDMGGGKIDGDYMLGKGTADPSRNPNSYPQTDQTRFPSAVTVWVNGENSGRYDLPDDPGDHRGILSWHAQPQNRKLNEAGSYGYRVSVPIAAEALRKAAQTGELVIRLAVDDSLPGGLAIYGADFGRYPIDPTVVLVLK
ncbi:hypothetical protein GCM10023189_48440 [Nibrella saemangeumensis]|uniref:Glycoside hydrolase family 2 n=1 Tax=Nibrella saemangeumensis TaxID=1084526 RepID=A0ABP8NG65_9BACT